MSDQEPKMKKGQSIAIVSGKGGSGKTLIATSIGISLASSGFKTVLVDGDLGTGGLTYYLGFTAFQGSREGVAEIISGKTDFSENLLSHPSSDLTNEINPRIVENLFLLPIGDHRKTIVDDFSDNFNKEYVKHLIEQLSEIFNYVVIDCRGGSDLHSLSLCENVDDILMVVETDAASIKASQHLSETLSDKGLRKNVAGFILNKVMDNPKTLANTGRSFFGADFLGAVPFEIDTTRQFIQGGVPGAGSLFQRQINQIVSNLYSIDYLSSRYSGMSGKDFDDISTESPDIKYGRYFAAFFIIITSIFILMSVVNNENIFSSFMTESDAKVTMNINFVIHVIASFIVIFPRTLSLFGRAARTYSIVIREVLLKRLFQ